MLTSIRFFYRKGGGEMTTYTPKTRYGKFVTKKLVQQGDAVETSGYRSNNLIEVLVLWSTNLLQWAIVALVRCSMRKLRKMRMVDKSIWAFRNWYDKLLGR